MRFLPWILYFVLLVYSWIEIAQSDPKQVRLLSRGMWSLIVLIPFAAIAWLVCGRPNGDDVPQPPARTRPRVIAPDDDPDFLRSLKPPPPPPPPPTAPDEGDQSRT